MHEYALADAVVAAARRAGSDAGMTRVERVVVSVGELRQIEADRFEFLLGEVASRSGPMLAGARFEVEREAVRFRCRACRREFGDTGEAPRSVAGSWHASGRCPGCAGADLDVVAGREVTLRRVEGSGERADGDGA